MLALGYCVAGRLFEHVANRLDAFLMVLKSCKAEECHEPWKVLYPQGNVCILRDVLRAKYDAFYNEQPCVSYLACELGYVLGSEGLQTGNVWGAAEDELVYNELRS